MRINDDLSRPVLIPAARQQWVASPAPGVDRRMLYREGAEIARATSIVRYAPGSSFAAHGHDGGEEILVLDGVFQDEHGDYPPGCYFRNPPGTAHRPASAGGCTIFVRLWQFRRGDLIQIVRQPDGTPERLLFDDGVEHVAIETWTPAASIVIDNPQGLEFLVVTGAVTIDGEHLTPESWGRLPAGTGLKATCGPEGATLWLKRAPLHHPDLLTMPT